jgi:hypothetical protein
MLPRRIDPRESDPIALDAAREHETKFVFGAERAHVLRRWLECRCAAHPLYPSSIVSSIYFDTRGWSFLREKINSDLYKLKARLRWYSDLATGEPQEVVHLEAKFKRGRARGKIRAPIDFSGRALSGLDPGSPELPDVADLLRTHGVDSPGLLFATFRIDYTRLRFLEPATGQNLCLDFEIHVPCVNRLMVARHDPRCLSDGVFELKGRSTELPPALGPLVKLGCRKQAFSKYLACHERLGPVGRTT